MVVARAVARAKSVVVVVVGVSVVLGVAPEAVVTWAAARAAAARAAVETVAAVVRAVRVVVLEVPFQGLACICTRRLSPWLHNPCNPFPGDTH